jgi:hypothetical protein
MRFVYVDANNASTPLSAIQIALSGASLLASADEVRKS